MARRWTKPHCKRCGRHRRDCGQLSAAGLCASCAMTGVAEAITAMRSKSGPHYERWRASRGGHG